MTGEWTGNPASTPHGTPADAGEASEAAPEPGRALAVAPTVGTGIARDATGRFLAGNSGNGGRRKGARSRLKEAVLSSLADHYAEHGKAALDKLAADDPASYLRAVTSLLPRETIAPDDYGDLSDDEIADVIERAERARRVRKIIEAIEQ